jgi:hypothetical protein
MNESDIHMTEKFEEKYLDKIELTIYTENNLINPHFSFHQEFLNTNRNIFENFFTIEDRLNLYKHISYKDTNLHEGAMRGLEYAINHYKANVIGNENFKTVINTSKINNLYHTHDSFAFLCAKKFWSILNFKPSIEIYFDSEKRKFIFPNSNNLIPYGRISLNEVERYIDYMFPKISTEDRRIIRSKLENEIMNITNNRQDFNIFE